jgi:hypothetical protein
MNPPLAFILILVIALFESGCRAESPPPTETGGVNAADAVDYDRVIHLDAENLAEEGIAEAYERLMPRLRDLGVDPVEIQERSDPDVPSYVVVFRNRTYEIWDSDVDEVAAWGKAAAALFEIVNSQLADTPYRFYALNHGNDLSGIFLKETEYSRAVTRTPRTIDRPFIPDSTPPWFGQPHD